MANEIYREEEAAVEIITHGSTIDDDPGFKGKVFTIETWTVRLNHVALNECVLSSPNFIDRFCYESEEEYQQKKAEQECKRENVEKKIGQLLGIDGDYTVSQNISEIFTVVQIRETMPDRKKAPMAEIFQQKMCMLNAMLCFMI